MIDCFSYTLKQNDYRSSELQKPEERRFSVLNLMYSATGSQWSSRWVVRENLWRL